MHLKHFFFFFLIGGMLILCFINESSDGEESGSVGISDAIGGLRNLEKAGDAAKNWEKIQEKLASETPRSNDEIKALFPENLAGMSRKSFSVGDAQMMGVNGGEAKYSNDDDKSVEVSIMDGAGEMGSSMVAMYAITLAMETEEETETGYSKTTKFNGNRATVKENTYDGRVDSEIITLFAERYIVSLDGSGLSLKELEKMFNELNLKSLD